MEIMWKNKLVLIDDEDFHLFNYNWAFDSNNYLSNRGKINERFHRYIMMDKIKQFASDNNIEKLKDIKIDHINRNVLDNRKCNLRCVTHNGNLMNRPKQRNNHSGYKNISLVQSYNKIYYDVAIKYSKKRYRKVFTTLEEAIKYRDEKLKELGLIN